MRRMSTSRRSRCSLFLCSVAIGPRCGTAQTTRQFRRIERHHHRFAGAGADRKRPLARPIFRLQIGSPPGIDGAPEGWPSGLRQRS